MTRKTKIGLTLLGLLAVLLGIFLAQPKGDVSQTVRTVEATRLCAAEDLDAACEAVEDYFQAHFPGCTLLALHYDSGVEEWEADYIEKIDGFGEDTLLLLSTIQAGPRGSDRFQPNSLTEGFTWLLKRQPDGDWTVFDCGY